MGCCHPKRRREAATWGTAASLLRGLVGEQKSRVIETVSVGGDAFVDKAAPQGVGSRLEVCWDGWLDLAEPIATEARRHGVTMRRRAGGCRSAATRKERWLGVFSLGRGLYRGSERGGFRGSEVSRTWSRIAADEFLDRTGQGPVDSHPNQATLRSWEILPSFLPVARACGIFAGRAGSENRARCGC